MGNRRSEITTERIILGQFQSETNGYVLSVEDVNILVGTGEETQWLRFMDQEEQDFIQSLQVG